MPAPPLAEDLVVVQSAVRRFGSRAALSGAALRACRGEILVLLGPNGAGKTTLLRALCGRTRLDSGSIRIAGGDPLDAAVRRRIGFVPQSIALWTQLSVRHNLELFGRLAGLGHAQLAAAVADTLDWTGLAARAGDTVAALSGGMQRRINIAAGTLHRPDLLLLDEPTVGLDPVARSEVHQVLDRLRRAGMCLIMTTHDLVEAEALADRVALMSAGAIRAEDSLVQLIGRLFGSDQEVVLMLAAEPAPAIRDALRAARLSPTNEAQVWIGRLSSGLESLPALRAQLISAGADIAELRIRQPGLHGVYIELTGQVPPR
ncbi:MAG: ABC transporter ATP-binding protein [Gammaproteobacteria bacterium]|nr:ABC transporter ATP-binding protein [Gammaproteobacteria bacterium]